MGASLVATTIVVTGLAFGLRSHDPAVFRRNMVGTMVIGGPALGISIVQADERTGFAVIITLVALAALQTAAAIVFSWEDSE